MPPRHPSLSRKRLPRTWLMTDERMGEDLWYALESLPRGSGVVFRHLATPASERRRLFMRVAKVARRNTLVLVVAGRQVGRCDGRHGAGPLRRGQIRIWPAHDRAEALAGVRAGADLLFVSPIFPTRSHPGAPALGALRATAIVSGLRIPAIALGGMTAARYRRLRGFHGWAAIDAWAHQPLSH